MTKPGDIWWDFEERLLKIDDGLQPIRQRRRMVDVRDHFAAADGSTDDSIAFVNALASLPSYGGDIVVPPAASPYHFDAQVSITKDNVRIILEPGAVIERDPNTTVEDEPFLFEGTEPASWDDTITDLNSNQVLIQVTTPGNFSIGDWIKIKDDQSPYSGSGTHWETNKIRNIAGDLLWLEWPLLDDYTTYASQKPRVSPFVPIINSGLYGAGKITNGDTTDASAGNACVRFKHAVGGYVLGGMEFEHFQQEAIRYFDSYAGRFLDSYIHDATNFDGSGRGITIARSHHVIVSDNLIVRTRHMVDVSNFCRQVVVHHNVCRGAGETALMLHPDTKWITVDNNTVDALWGFATGGAEWGSPSTAANGIHIGDEGRHIRITKNRISNCLASGILCWRDNVQDVLIEGNELSNCNIQSNTVYQGGIVVAQLIDTTALGENIVVKGNTVSDTLGRGILIGGSKVTCEGNVIKTIGSSGDTAGILVRPWVTSGTPDAIEQVIIKGNTIEDITGYGIRIGTNSSYKVTDSEIVENHVRNTSLSGIYAIPNQVSAITIDSNYIRDPNTGVSSSHAGIAVGATANSDVTSVDLQITRNKVWCGTSTRGIMACVSGVVIRGNEIYENVTLGIYVPVGAAAQDVLDAVVEANVVIGGSYGIYIADSSGGTVTTPHIVGNILSGCTTGMRFNATCTSGILIDNVPINCTTDITDNGSTTLKIFTHYDLTNYRKRIMELQVDGNIGFYGTTPVAQSSAYSPSNVTTDRTYDANATSLNEIADVLGTLIADLQATGIIG